MISRPCEDGRARGDRALQNVTPFSQEKDEDAVRRRRARGLTWVLLAAVLLGGRVLHAQEKVSVWIERLAAEATRDQARDKLRDLGRKAVGPLVRALRHPHPIIRSESAFVLGRIGGTSAVTPLIRALKDKDAEVRKKAAYGLGEIADVRAIDGLVAVLSDPDAGVRANGCFALGQIGKPQPARALVKALTDADESVRNHAANALGFCREPKALPALAWTASHDKSTGVRALATASMGHLEDARACATLIALLEDKQYLVRARAIESLLVLTHQRRGYDPRPKSASRRAAAVTAWKNWEKKNRAKLGTLTARTPMEVYDWWFGKPVVAPKPDPASGGLLPRDALGAPPVTSDARIEITTPRDGDFKRTKPTDEQIATFAGAMKHFEAGRFADAARGFEQCIVAAPAWKDAHFNLALTLRRLGRLQKSADEYRIGQQLDPRDAEVYNNLGCLHEFLGRPVEAETYYRLGLAVAPKDVRVRVNLAGMLHRQGKLIAARGEYEGVLKAKTLPAGLDASLLKVRLAECLLAWDKRARAAALLDEASAKSQSARVLREAARQCFRMRRFAKAKLLLERARGIAEDEAETAWMLALFYLRVPEPKLHDAVKAAFHAELAVTAKPRDARYVAATAEVAYARGEKTKALELAEAALKLAPKSAAIQRQCEKYRKEAAKTDGG